jgi:Fe2+ or Zn2+ uptake regulation protein
VERFLRKKYGFHIDFNHLIMSGVCRECEKSAR